LIDRDEDWTLRAVLVEMQREADWATQLGARGPARGEPVVGAV
jgi:hypothetical protein